MPGSDERVLITAVARLAPEAHNSGAALFRLSVGRTLWSLAYSQRLPPAPPSTHSDCDVLYTSLYMAEAILSYLPSFIF